MFHDQAQGFLNSDIGPAPARAITPAVTNRAANDTESLRIMVIPQADGSNRIATRGCRSTTIFCGAAGGKFLH